MKAYVEDLRREYTMQSIASQEPIWFTGTHKTYRRTIYRSDDKYFCKWYGRVIELKKDHFGCFETVDAY